MTYLLWAILNIALFILFIFVCFSAIKLIKEKFGIILAVFFVYGLFSFAFKSDKESNNNQRQITNTSTWNLTPSDSIISNTMTHKTITLKDNMISTYIFSVTYGRHKSDSSIVPIATYSLTNGFTGGTTWTPSFISILPSDKIDHLDYSVTGQIEWKLLGGTFFSQSKTFSGTISTK